MDLSALLNKQEIGTNLFLFTLRRLLPQLQGNMIAELLEIQSLREEMSQKIQRMGSFMEIVKMGPEG